MITRIFDVCRIVPVDYFETFKAGDLEVTSLKANHKANGRGEYAQNYIIQLKDNRKLLYAVDTGWYSEETWEFVKGKRIDILVIESTYGELMDGDIHPDCHQDARSMLLMLEKMKSIGFIDHNVKVYATHINHKHNLLHDDLQNFFDSSGFKATVAYDGLMVK